MASEIRYRRSRTVSDTAFAGRLGGNQGFTVTDENEKGEKLLRKQPDAAPVSSIRASLSLNSFFDPDLWRQAIIEGWATCLLTFVLSAAGSGLSLIDAHPLALTCYATLLNVVGLTLFISSTAPITGGHLNPLITMGTFFTGLSTLPRAMLYILAQSIGSIVGAYWLRLAMGDAFFPLGDIPGCTVDASLVSPGQMFVLEYIFCQALLFIAFGIGLEPRQAKILGPAYSLVLVGFALSLPTLASVLARPGYSGVSLNPARCLGLMAAKADMKYHYIHWLGPLAAALTNAVFYQIAPPYVKDKSLLARVRRHKPSAA